MELLQIVVIILVLIFLFINGFHDGCNILNPIISTRVLDIRPALYILTISEFVGAIFLGSAVTKTIGEKLVHFSLFSLYVLVAGVIGAIIWNLLTWYWKVPSSSSQALIGGILGSSVANLFYLQDMSLIYWKNVFLIVIILLCSPFIGFLISWILTKLAYTILIKVEFKKKDIVRIFHLASFVFLGLVHGSNDVQKGLGVILISFLIVGVNGPTPLWIRILTATVFALGVSRGGWRIMRSLSYKLYKIRSFSGFISQSSAALTVGSLGFIGFPVSSTQILFCSLIGTGTALQAKTLRWGLIKNIFIFWFLTMPITAIISFSTFILLKNIG